MLQTEVFTGTLQPLGSDTKTFRITYTGGPSDLSVTVNSLTALDDEAPVTDIAVGIGLGLFANGTCTLQLHMPIARLNEELFAPNGAGAGNYCVLIHDCPSGATGCVPMLPEPVTYRLTVKHF